MPIELKVSCPKCNKPVDVIAVTWECELVYAAQCSSCYMSFSDETPRRDEQYMLNMANDDE